MQRNIVMNFRENSNLNFIIGRRILNNILESAAFRLQPRELLSNCVNILSRFSIRINGNIIILVLIQIFRNLIRKFVSRLVFHLEKLGGKSFSIKGIIIKTCEKEKSKPS